MRSVIIRMLVLSGLLFPALVSAVTPMLAVGGNYTVALKSDGTVSTWGYNQYGQLGDGTTTQRNTPVTVPGLTGVVSIAVGAMYTVALKSDGTVVAWGYNGNGQLGDGTTTQRNSPVTVPGLTGVVAIAVGDNHCVALKSDGTVVGWGDNTPMTVSVAGASSNGQSGNATATHFWSPEAVPGLTGVVSIAAAYGYSVALKSDGTVAAWGDGFFGQLGDGTSIYRNNPVAVPGLGGVIAIAADRLYTLALKSDGTVKAWGDNIFGELGDGTTTSRNTPVTVSELTGVIALATGYSHAVALKSDGTVVAWGYNGNGQLGDGTTTNRNSPVVVRGLGWVTAVATGFNHSVALKSDGTVVTWGMNNHGALGDGTLTNRSSPLAVPGFGGEAAAVPGFSEVAAVAAGSDYTVALQSDGTVVTWGYNINGQLGDGTTIDRLTPVVAQYLNLGASTIKAHAPVSAFISDERVFNFAAANYPSLFAGWAMSGQYQQYHYRYYWSSQNYLAVDTGGMVSIKGAMTGGAIIPVGTVASFANTIAAWEVTAADTQAPTTPAGLNASVLNSSQIRLAWTASNDNVGVTHYKINRIILPSCPSTASSVVPPPVYFTTLGAATVYIDPGLSPSTNYDYDIQACDVAGNCSAHSYVVSCNTAGNCHQQ